MGMFVVLRIAGKYTRNSKYDEFDAEKFKLGTIQKVSKVHPHSFRTEITPLSQ